MDMRSSSPERPTIQKTYIDGSKQSKRKRPEGGDESEGFSDHEASISPKKARSPSPIEVAFSGPITKSALKKVASGAKLVDTSRRDLNLPGPEPRRPPPSANSVSTPSSTKERGSMKSPSSMSSSSRPPHTTPTPTKPVSTSASSRKPPSTASIRSSKPPSVSRRTGTPETEMDDATSIAESAVSMKGRKRTEAERIQYFRDQPLCGDIGPHAVLCKRCGRTVKLAKASTYNIRAWEIHRVRCDIMMKSKGAGEDSGSAPSGGSGLRLTIAERKAFLEEDPNCTDVEPVQVVCTKCRKTVRLSTKGKYQLNNWLAHGASCAASQLPSTRVETATRQVQLVNDPQAKSFGTRYVDCAYCHQRVDLTGPGDYRLESWNEHKNTCSLPDRPPTDDTQSGPSSVSTVPFPSAEGPSLSDTAITDVTLAAQEPHHASTSEGVEPDGQKGKKRVREDDNADPQTTDSQDVRPSNRPRTSSQDDAPGEESPGMLGWMMLPFHAFVRGFRESLSRG